MRQDIEAAIKKTLVSALFVEIPEEEIGVDDSLQSTIGLDSLDFVELRVRCEQLFDIRIADEDFMPDNFRTIRVLTDLVTSLQHEQSNSES